MANSEKIKISEAKDLYSILPEEFREEFAIGMHEFRDGGVFGGRPEHLQGEWSQETVREVKESILSNGLNFSKHSKLLSTVMFDDREFDSYISRGPTRKGGVIIALPKVMRSESGKEIFVGSPQEHSNFRKYWARREQATSLSDIILPGEGVLNPMFVIGTYTNTDNGIEITLNQNHIAFNKGRVPDTFFEERYDKLINGGFDEEMDDAIIEETIEQQRNYKGTLNPSFDLKTEESKKAQYVIDYINTQGGTAEMSQEDIHEYVAHLRTIGLDDLADTIQETIKTVKTKDDRVEKLSMAIAEMRNAGINDKIIKSYMAIGETGILATPEALDTITQVFEKYGINNIIEEDYNAHDFRQSDEMRMLISKLMRNPEQELKEGHNPEISHFSSQEDVTQLDDMLQMQQGEEQHVLPSTTETPKVEISQEKVDKLRMAIQEARQQGMDVETIKKYIYPFQTIKGWNMEDFNKWADISAKYGIREIMSEDYMSQDKAYSGFSIEMSNVIDSLTQEEIQELEDTQFSDTHESIRVERAVSLTELGKKSYQHFGRRIVDKLKQTINALKSKFLSKDKNKTEDLTNGR